MTRRRLTIAALVAVYLAAIIAANLISTHYGPTASIYNAFFLIGLDLTTRDRLHDFWGQNRWAKMAGLILTGAVLSWIVNRHAIRIAEASAIAFAAAENVDAVTYQILHRREWLERSNVSNVLSAAVDSLIFPTIAFGGLLWGVTFGQFTAKIAGGFLWSLALSKVKTRRRAVPVAAQKAVA